MSIRLLLTTIPSSGHLHPLIPVAMAARAAGHEVAVACAESLRPAVEELGLRVFPAGLNRDGDGDPEFDRLKEHARTLSPGPEMDRLAVADVLYGVRARHMLPDVLEICRAFRPDVILRDCYEAAGAVAGDLLGIPHAGVEIMPLFDTTGMRGAIRPHLDRLRASVGLPPDPELEMLHRHLHLCFAPPSLLDPAIAAPPTLRTLRPVFYDQVDTDHVLPTWLLAMPPLPTVYVTAGTVANRWRSDVFPGLFTRIIAGLRDEPVNVVVTVGRDHDPAALGPQPPNVHVEQFIPHTLLLAHCDVAVTHGGFNTVMAAIDAQLLQVLVPLTSDDPYNARRCEQLGLAQVVPPDELTPQRLRDAVRTVLADPSYRANTQRMRAEMHQLPGPEAAVGLLEDLAAGHDLGRAAAGQDVRRQ